MDCKWHESPLYGLAAVVSLVLLCSCSTYIKYDEQHATGLTRPADCDLDIAMPSDSLKGSVRKIGHIFIGDTGFSIDCSWDAVMKNLRENACATGADAVKVTSVKPPDWISTCYRMDADFYVYSKFKPQHMGHIAKQQVQPQVKKDTDPPLIKVTEPNLRAIRRRVKSKTIRVAGTVIDVSGVYDVRINGQEIGLDKEGVFSLQLSLAVGDNTVEIVARDIHMNSARQFFKLERESVAAAILPGNEVPQNMLGADRFVSAVYSESVNYALLIGNNNYKYLPKLKTARQDVRDIATLLEDRFGFTVRVLLDVGRDQIIRELNTVRRKLSENDTFLLYYAGHGHFDVHANKAYWLPLDARTDEDTEWIIVDTITSNLRRMAPRHILVVADSCYSGTLTRRVLTMMESTAERNRFLDKMWRRSSRTLLASGGNEPVADSGGSGHSVFAEAFIGGLEDMERPEFTTGELFYEHIKERVAGNSNQVPEYNTIRNSGHDGGDFIFHRH